MVEYDPGEDTSARPDPKGRHINDMPPTANRIPKDLRDGVVTHLWKKMCPPPRRFEDQRCDNGGHTGARGGSKTYDAGATLRLSCRGAATHQSGEVTPPRHAWDDNRAHNGRGDSLLRRYDQACK